MTTDLFFRATSRATWDRFAGEAGLGSDGVNIDFIEGPIVKAAVLGGIHANLRLTGAAERKAPGLRKVFTDANDRRAVTSKRRAKTHSWLHKVFTGGGAGEVGLIDPAPEVPARIWFGDAAPVTGRS